MNGSAATLPGMGSRKEDKKPGRPAGRKPTTPLSARIDPALAQDFVEHVESLRPKTSVSAVIEMLIEQYMRKQPSAQRQPPPAKE